MWNQRLIRLAVLQQLRAVYGIKVKGDRGRRRRDTASTETGGKIFGVPFNALPNSVVPEYGHIPSFLVDACTSLEEHIHTEGLFRKSGSVIRLKGLKNKLDHGEECLSSALPCDVAGLLKQFFRELPEPILPADLHDGLVKAQQLGAEEKNTATQLLSCLMADRTVDTLRYFFNFLRNVSLRSSENKMDSSNLAVIFAPNLLQTSESYEKMSANTEKKLRLHAAVVQTLIDHASDIGRVPDFILEKMPAMLGIDGLCATPSLEGFEEGEWETPGECKRKRRQSVGDFVNGALSKLKSNRTPSITPQQDGAGQSSASPVVLTPNAKRKLPVDSSHGFSSKKRKSVKHSFNFELLPNNFFSSSSTPLSVHCDTSPEGSSQSSFSPVTVSGNHSIGTGVLRRSKRIAGKKICRMESGKTGCFSPKVTRKEKVQRSLRLKFSLGKNRDANGCSGINRYESVGRRLANQPSLKNRVESVKTGLLFSPDIDGRLSKKGSEKISKSEENLLTPERLDGTSYQMSWTGPSNSSFHEMDTNESSPMTRNLEVKNFSLEPEIMAEMSPGTSGEPAPSTSDKPDGDVTGSSLSGDESNLTSETLVKIQRAFSESGDNLQALISHRQSLVPLVGEGNNEMSCIDCTSEQTLFETNDLTVRESKENYENHTGKHENCFSDRTPSPHLVQKFGRKTTVKSCSTQMKLEHKKDVDSYIQEGRLGPRELTSNEQSEEPQALGENLNTLSKTEENRIEENLGPCAVPREDEARPSSSQQSTRDTTKLSKPRPARIAKHQSLEETCNGMVSKSTHMTEHGRVSDHIQWFNKLSLNEPNRTKVKSPLKFQRTPVRQSVRRINSLLEHSRETVRQKLTYFGDTASPLVKSVSCDGALPSCIETTSKESSISCIRCGPEDQKSTSCQNANLHTTSKSHIGLASKPSLKLKRLPDSVNAIGSTKVCHQEVMYGVQVKVPLDDLTNHDIVKSVVNNNVVNSPGMKNRALRKPSERERVWYKGSPKHPIGKASLLPTSKPLDL
ncbi:rho GTPase-activating protein 11A [Ctenodactylus gundi]